MAMTPKLRASCDQCHSAKIKCIKTATDCCQRCGSSGEQCKYSPALPRGYSKKKDGGKSSIPHASPPTASSESSLLNGIYGHTVAQDNLDQEIYPPEAPIFQTATASAVYEQHVYGIDANDLTPYLWPYVPDGPMQGAQELLAPNPWPGSYAASPSTTTTSPGMTDGMTLNTTASTPSSLPLASSGPKRQTQVSSGGQDATHPLTKHDTIPSCDCFTRLLRAMQQISAYAGICTPKLDVVLRTNRTATKDCLASLQCERCAPIAFGLLDRIVLSYQAALETFCSGLDDESEQAKDGPGGRGSQRHEGGEGSEEVSVESTTTLQLHLGSFALENSDQVLHARIIVAGELGRIREALKGCEADVRGLGSMLLGHLIKRCGSVIDEVSTR